MARRNATTAFEKVRRAAEEIGPGASLHEIAYRSDTGHMQASRILRMLGAAQVSSARTDTGGPGRASRWTLRGVGERIPRGNAPHAAATNNNDPVEGVA